MPSTNTVISRVKESPTVVYQSDFAGQENFAGTVPFPVISDRDKGAGDADNRARRTRTYLR